MTAWYSIPVVSVLPEATDLSVLTLDVSDTPLAGTHRCPGQFVRLRLPSVGKAVFAIASAPEEGQRHWEFLLKHGSSLPDALVQLAPGARVESTPPDGKGFPLQSARGRSLLLFATGSGISPIRSVIESLRRERKAYGPVTLYFGARTPDSFAYADELDHWEASGIRVVRTVSRPGASGWQGLTGYVQSHLIPAPFDDAVAFVCGQEAMVEGVIEALRAHGLSREAIHLNY